MKAPLARLSLPIATTVLIFGVCSTLLGISFRLGSPDVWAWACRWFGAGGLVGFFVAIRVFRETPVQPLAQRSYAHDNEPAKLYVKDPEHGNVTKVWNLASLSYRQLYDISTDVIIHEDLTFNNLRTWLADQDIKKLHKELEGRRWAWRPSSNSALRLTDKGREMFQDAHQQLYPIYNPSPTPVAFEGAYT